MRNIILTILWIALVTSNVNTLVHYPFQGFLLLMFQWILLYGHPLYFHMRRKHIEFETKQQHMFRIIYIQQRIAFYNSIPRTSRISKEVSYILDEVQKIKNKLRC